MSRARPGAATLNNWTPKRAHSFGVRRLEKIKGLLQEIAYCYGDVDNTVVLECDDAIDKLDAVRDALDESLAEGRTL